MMGVFFFFFFLTPLLFFGFWFFFQFSLVFIFLYFMCFDFNSYFSSISYLFGIDFFSFMLILLTFFVTSLMILSSSSIYLMYSRFFFLFHCFFLCFLLFMVFSILNMILMYIFFELTLIPLLIIILMWGYQPERLVSSFYLFFYTLFGSLPLLCFIFYLYLIYGLVFFDLTFSFNFNFFSHLCLIFAFLVSFPIYMFHFWLPSAHVQAPVSGSMILAGLMLKIGGYGIFRFMFLSEVGFYYYSYLWFTFGVLGSLYICLFCFFQGDLSCMIAYSSVCHMGLCLCGLLTMTKFGIFGSLFMMISHGLCSSGLFFLANCVYERLYSRSFYLSSGMIYFMPGLSFFWFLFCCFNMGCPPSLNFISEFLIIFSLISYWHNSFVFIIIISFLVACFSYYLYSCSHHGLFLNLYSYSMIYVREYLISFCHIYPLLVLVFFINFIF